MHRSRSASALTRLAVTVALVALAAPMSALPGNAPEDDWWRFRGPNGAGVSDATDLPVEFGPGHNEIWSQEVPSGRSSPILVGELVVLTAMEGTRLSTMALSRADGSMVWKRSVEAPRDDDLYYQNDSSSPTPSSNGEAIFVFFAELGLVSYDLEGNERWRAELGPFANFYGVAASPIVHGDQILLLVDQVNGSALLSLDQATGAETWRADRSGRIESWTTPVLYPPTGTARHALVFGSGWVDAYDLTTGEPAWEMPGVGEGPVASPVVVGSRMFAMAPNHGESPLPSFASLAAGFDADGDGRLSEPEFANVEGLGEHFGWTDRNDDGYLTPEEFDNLMEMAATHNYGLAAVDLPGPGGPEAASIVWSQQQSVGYIASPLVYGDVVYMVRDGGIVSSVDAATGEVHKRARFSRSAGQVFASPVAGEGKIYIGSLEGELAVLSAVADWQVLALNDLGAPIFASPALADGRLYVRTASRLHAFGVTDE